MNKQKQKSFIQEVSPLYIIVVLALYVLTFMDWRSREDFNQTVNWPTWVLLGTVSFIVTSLVTLYRRARRGEYSPAVLDRLRLGRMIGGGVMIALPFVVIQFYEFTAPIGRYLRANHPEYYGNTVVVVGMGIYFAAGLFLVFLGRAKITGTRVAGALVGSAVGAFFLFIFYEMMAFTRWF